MTSSRQLTRRGFIAGASLGSLGLAWRQEKKRAGSMYLSMHSTLVAGRVAWPEFATLAAKVGFPATDVPMPRALQEGAEKTRALLQELKLKPAVVQFPVDFRKDEATFRESFKGLEAAAQFAAAIGCPRMATWIPASSETPKAELRKTCRLKRFSTANDSCPAKASSTGSNFFRRSKRSVTKTASALKFSGGG